MSHDRAATLDPDQPILDAQSFDPVHFLDEVFDAFEELDSVIVGFAEENREFVGAEAAGFASPSTGR